ncbi:MAG: hypothetical protein WCG14_00260 [Chlamydiia bacterium]
MEEIDHTRCREGNKSPVILLAKISSIAYCFYPTIDKFPYDRSIALDLERIEIKTDTR